MALDYMGAIWFRGEANGFAEEIARLSAEWDGASVVEKSGRNFFVRVANWHDPEHRNTIESGGAISIVNGDPIVAAEEFQENQSVESEWEFIHRQLRAGDHSVLRQISGTCSVIHIDENTGSILLASDKVGLSPVYYIASSDCLVFSTSLRLAGFRYAVKGIDDVGLAESALLGFTQADRTAFSHVRRVYAGCAVTADRHSLRRNRYWALEQTEPFRGEREEFRRVLYEKFVTGVRRRLRSRKSTSAFLSGGLDSRCVVGALKVLDCDVHTYNISLPDSLDLVLGREFAEKASTRHSEYEMPWREEDFWLTYRRLSQGNADATPDVSQAVWSGEGGSVGLGHIYITEELCELSANRRLIEPSTIAKFRDPFAQHGRWRALRGRTGDDWNRSVRESIAQEFRSYGKKHPSRHIYGWLVLNEQRHHLDDYFETLCQHKTDVFLPFFDSEFVAAVYSAPTEWFLRHDFYNEWLGEFPSYVGEVPWQSYPSHVPCPHPIPEGHTNQFALGKQALSSADMRQRYNKLARGCLRDRNAPILSKPVLLYQFVRQRLSGSVQMWFWERAHRIQEAFRIVNQDRWGE